MVWLTADLFQAIKKSFKPSNMYSKSPEKFAEALQAVDDYCTENKEVLEKRKVAEVVIVSAKHNNPGSPDPKGDHWTVKLLKETGKFVTKKHIYPRNSTEGGANAEVKGEAKEPTETAENGDTKS